MGFRKTGGLTRDEPIPGAHLVQSRPDIRLRVGTGVLRAEFRRGQCGQAGVHARGDILRVVAAFEREDDFPLAVLICQSDQMPRESEETG